MTDLGKLNELNIAIRSQILEKLQAELRDPDVMASSTQYVKSDGTNYGMYTKSDPSLVDIWETVINQGLAKNPGRTAGPESPQS
jgi:hypothetical protein